LEAIPTVNSQTVSHSPSLEEWIQRISVEEMPIMYRTALDIARLASDDGAPSTALVNAILKEPGLTARVLSLANSAYYKAGSPALSTVSRAVIVLGSNAVRSICLSVTLVDSLLQGLSRERLLRELAESFHAAVVARRIATEKGDESPEEVFVAALLFRLGEMSFWCFGGELREVYEKRLEHKSETKRDIERELLDFTLRDLSVGLAEKWKLGSLLIQALGPEHGADRRSRYVQLSHSYVKSLERRTDSKELNPREEEIAKMLGLPSAGVQKVLKECAREAIETARLAGAGLAANHIARLFVDEAPKVVKLEPEKKAPLPEQDYAEFDPLLQLKILRELTTLISTTCELNDIVETVLEGMYRSLGMDRALFALVSNDRKKLVGRFSVGHEASSLEENFDWSLSEHEGNIFYTALERKSILWGRVGNPVGSNGFIERRVRQLVGAGPFFVAPAIMNGLSIGLFYVDRRMSGRALDEESFQAFKHFSQQANLGLDFLARRREHKDKEK